jgi:fructose-1,6-bisphosphatase II
VNDSATSQPPDRNLSMELVRATEAAALAAGRWMGRNRKNDGDQAAVDAMRLVLNSVQMDGTVIIGEGEKDEAPMLYNGEEIGTREPPEIDIAVDPIDGTRLLAEGRNGSIAVIAAAPRGAMYDPGPMVYMEKWIVGEEAKGVIDIDAPVARNLEAVAKAKGKDVNDLLVIMLDRDRHDELKRDIRQTGARLKLIMDGDVAAGVEALLPTKAADVLVGIGGTPEGVITACAVHAIGGEMLGRLWARNEGEVTAAKEQDFDIDEILTTERLVNSTNTFFVCTGITNGDLVEGVRYIANGAHTESLAMRGKSGTIRRVRAFHRFDKLREYAAIDFD